MTNKQLIQNFINGATAGKANSLTIDGDRLLSYKTSICIRKGGGAQGSFLFYVNVEKYSDTTTKQINLLRSKLNHCRLEMGKGRDKGIDHLME